MNAPIAIAAAIPPVADVTSWTEMNVTGSTSQMLPVNSARVARGMKNLCA